MPAPAVAQLLSAITPAGGGTFDPFSVGWHTAFWADDPSWSNPGNGNAVSSWRDGSGNGRDAVQATGGNQPIFRSSVALLNNRGAVDFDGSDDFLNTATFTIMYHPFTMVWIGKRDGAGQLNGERLIEVSDANSYSCLMMDNPTGKWALYTGGQVNSAASYDTTAGHAIRGLCDYPTSTLNVDGATTTGATVNPEAIYVTLGRYRGGTTAAANIHIAFAGLYAGNITADSDWAAFVSWVSSYYGLTIA